MGDWTERWSSWTTLACEGRPGRPGRPSHKNWTTRPKNRPKSRNRPIFSAEKLADFGSRPKNRLILTESAEIGRFFGQKNRSFSVDFSARSSWVVQTPHNWLSCPNSLPLKALSFSIHLLQQVCSFLLTVVTSSFGSFQFFIKVKVPPSDTGIFPSPSSRH